MVPEGQLAMQLLQGALDQGVDIQPLQVPEFNVLTHIETSYGNLALYVPAGQFTQDSRPGALVLLPSSHTVHLDPLETWYACGQPQIMSEVTSQLNIVNCGPTQVEQDLHELYPVPEAYVPRAHDVQDVDPAEPI